MEGLYSKEQSIVRIPKRNILCLHEKRNSSLPKGWKIQVINRNDIIRRRRRKQDDDEPIENQVEEEKEIEEIEHIEWKEKIITNKYDQQQQQEVAVIQSRKNDTESITRILDMSTSTINNNNNNNDIDQKSATPDIEIDLSTLSEEQKYALQVIVDQRKNVFFTGSAGTGKSYLLRAIIKKLEEKYGKNAIAITASTGIAASNIGGTTVHSYAGIGLGNKGTNFHIKTIKRNGRLMKRWSQTKVWIIDEVSMLNGEILDLLEILARELKKVATPFGNIQVILCGDFLQLPPVERSPNKKLNFAFQANCWNRVIQETIILKQVFRQKDQGFINMLNQIRIGKLTSDTIQKLKSLERPPITQPGIVASQLFSLRKQVDRYNEKELAKLKGTGKIYQASINGPWKFENHIVPETLSLKMGAQVILIKNLTKGLVNGSIGKVIGFFHESPFDNEEQMKKVCALPGDSENKIEERYLDLITTKIPYPVIDFGNYKIVLKVSTWSYEDNEGNVLSSVKQIPLILAWAISIHKSQGQSLNSVCVNLESIFADGQAYVALSRATSLQGLQVLNFNTEKVHVNADVIQFYNHVSSTI